MLLLLHALIPCFAAYILCFGLRILLLLCALNPCVATYILHCFSTFWHCHPYILMEMFLFTDFSLYTCLQMLFAGVQAPPLFLLVVI